VTQKAPLQFGEHEPGVVYRDRHCAFGVAERDGKLALVCVRRDGREMLDLPGGALDEGEDEPGALAREFAEETGLKVRVAGLLCRADQYVTKSDGEKVNNRAGFYHVVVEADAPELKKEANHELVWLSPQEAVARLRHDSQAWAAACHMRRP
jgi:8-oxo-dGTP diphosphatase